MNRRKFFASLGALAMLPVLNKLPLPTFQTEEERKIALVKRLMENAIKAHIEHWDRMLDLEWERMHASWDRSVPAFIEQGQSIHLE